MPRMGVAAPHDILSATHTDVDAADTPADQDVLTWDDGAGEWIAQAAPGAGGGEANTASNQGVGGVGVFLQKTAVDLEFKNINAGSSKITVTNDAVNNEVDLDVAEGQLSLANLGIRAHGNLTGVGANDHHNESHSVASHNDTTATGAELETLTDGVSNADALHLHSHGALTGVTNDQHHNEDHASRHADGGGDELAVQDLASDAATDGQVAKADGAGAVAFEDDSVVLNFIIDGGGSAISTGEKGHVEIPFGMVIEGWTILSDQPGSIVVDVWKDTYANFPPTVADTIAGSEKPTLSTAQKNQDLSLTTWTTTVSAGDILAFNVDSASTVKRVTVALRGRKT